MPAVYEISMYFESGKNGRGRGVTHIFGSFNIQFLYIKCIHVRYHMKGHNGPFNLIPMMWRPARYCDVKMTSNAGKGEKTVQKGGK